MCCMKRCCKVGILAWYELRTQWKGFVFFGVISAILLSAVISIFTLARRVPGEITEYMQATGEGNIVIQRLPLDQLSVVDAMPVKVMDYHISFLEATAIGLPSNWSPQKVLENGDACSLPRQGGVIRWLPEEHSFHAVHLEQQLIAGRAPARQDDADAAIWLSEDAAAQLGAVCGDTVSFCADSTAAQSISCQIAGIYQQNIYLYSYYVSLPLYLQSLDTVESMQVILAPLNLKDYQNVLAELRANRIFPDEAQEFMDSVMLLVYALYVVCVFLCILEVGMVFTISRSYFHRRTAFFAVCKALGMQNRSMLLTVCMLMQALLSVAFLAAMLLAPYLNRYVGNLLNELFTDVKISESVWNPFSLLILLITSGLLWLTCICSQKTYAAPELVELIRQEDQ